MKKQKEERQTFSASNKFERVWKMVAIAVIIVFALLLAGGLIKAHYIRSSFVKPTQAQADYAAKIASEKLQSTGINPSAFQVQTGRMMRAMHYNADKKLMLQVSFYNNSTTHTYLVDVTSGEIILHSETDTYIAFGEHQNKRHYDDHFEINNMMYKGLKP